MAYYHLHYIIIVIGLCKGIFVMNILCHYDWCFKRRSNLWI